MQKADRCLEESRTRRGLGERMGYSLYSNQVRDIAKECLSREDDRISKPDMGN
jgi:hypothetical protein